MCLGPNTSNGSAVVLLVEDDPESLRITSYFLRQLGHLPLAASGTVEAVELAHANRSRIDLLVTDVAMPVMSGIELAQRVRAERPSLPVIFLLGVSPAPLSPLPGIGFLRKPFSKSELAALVRSTLGETRAPIAEAGLEMAP